MPLESAGPAPRAKAWLSVARFVGTSGLMLVRRQPHLPKGNVGRVLHFADGSTSRVYRAAHQPDHAWWRIVAQAPSRQQGGG